MLLRAAIIACTALVLASCSAGDHVTVPQGELRRGLSAQPETLDPQQARSVAALKVIGDLYEGLLTRNAQGALIPGAAIDWRVSDDQRKYTFTLREDARWSDGRPVVAADFVRAWRYLAAPDSRAFYADLLRPLEHADDVFIGARLPTALGVIAVDERTLLVSLSAPRADMLERFAHPALSPRAASPEPVATNGAYTVAADDNAGRLALVANEHFHAAADVSIPRVVYQSFEQELTEYNEFRSGGLDITSRVPRQVFRDSEGDNPALRAADYLGVAYLSFNMRSPPPLSLRRALTLAIDREAIATQVLGRGEAPAWGMVAPGSANVSLRYVPYAHPQASHSLAERQTEARALFERVAQLLGAPVELTLHYASADENRVVAAALQSMWQSSFPGIEIKLENKEFRVLLAMSRGGDFDGLVRGSWIADYNDAGQFLAILASDSPANTSGFSDARFDALLAAAQTTTDPARRQSTLQAMEKLIAEQVPVIPLHYFVSKHLVSERVSGWQDNPLDLHYSRFLRLAGEPPRELP